MSTLKTFFYKRKSMPTSYAYQLLIIIIIIVIHYNLCLRFYIPCFTRDTNDILEIWTFVEYENEITNFFSVAVAGIITKI